MANIFKDKKIVFTGDMSLERNYAKSKVILLGGRVTTSVSKLTDYLVVGNEPGPSKMKKASDLGTRLIYETEFTKYLEEAIQETDKTININKSDTGMVTDTDCVSSDFDDTNVLDSFRQVDDPTMWTEKYRPICRKDLVGNPSVLNSLEDFLKGNTKFKGALISGSPGVGKTSSVYILCKELDLDLIEFNASDVRNKSLLISKIKGLVNTKGLTNNMKLRKKVIMMDEIDGMTSDRGGLLELNTLIKESSVPFVCICNDRNNLKIRTLGNNCLDLRFRKLESRQILPRIKEILKKEGKHIGDNILNEIISLSDGDIRYILNTVQRMCVKETINFVIASGVVKKTQFKSVFEIAAEVFHKKSINDKINLYFEDYSLIPLFVSENYLKMNFKNLNEFYDSADSLSQGDVVEKLIRGSTQEWSLTPLHGFFTVVLPTKSKILNKRIDFPSWLGQNSKHQKYRKNIRDVCSHTFRHIRSGPECFRQYESNLIYYDFIAKLKNDRIKEALDVLCEYDILKDDMTNLSEILIDGSVLFKEVKTKNKSEFTRSYNKLKRGLPYTVEEIKKSKSVDIEEEEEEEY
jgi:replication factor C subunit 1